MEKISDNAKKKDLAKKYVVRGNKDPRQKLVGIPVKSWRQTWADGWESEKEEMKIKKWLSNESLGAVAIIRKQAIHVPRSNMFQQYLAIISGGR